MLGKLTALLPEFIALIYHNCLRSEDRKNKLKIFSVCFFIIFFWAELDLNQRRQSQRIYNPPPLTTRASTHHLERLTKNIKEFQCNFNYFS